MPAALSWLAVDFPHRHYVGGSVMSADTEYTGGAARDIRAEVSAPTRPNPRRAQRILPILSTARILDTLQKKRGAGCYTGLDNTSSADMRCTCSGR
jgi:hypothetical protein